MQQKSSWLGTPLDSPLVPGCNPLELGALGGFLCLSELPSGGITVPGARLGLGGSVGPIPSSLF